MRHQLFSLRLIAALVVVLVLVPFAGVAAAASADAMTVHQTSPGTGVCLQESGTPSELIDKGWLVEDTSPDGWAFAPGVVEGACPKPDPGPQPADIVVYGDWMGGEATCDNPSVTQTRTVTTTSFVLSSDGSTWVQGQPVVTTETQTDTLTSEEQAACNPPDPGPQPADIVVYGDWMGGEATCDNPSVTQTRTVTTTSFVLSSDGSTWVQGQPVVTTETQTDTLTSEELTACQPGNSGDNGNQKITFCHVPPGNPGNAHTITTSINAAVQAGHFVLDQEGDIVTPGGHGGDYLGKCQAASTPPSNGGTETPTATPTNTPTLPSGGGTQTPPSGTETPVSTQPSGGHGGTQTPASTPPSGNNGGENNGQPPVVPPSKGGDNDNDQPPVVNPPSNGGNPSGGQQIAEVVQQPVNGNVSQPSNAAVSGGQQASAGPSTVSELPIAGSGDSFGNNSGNPLLPLISFGSALCALLGWYMRRYGLGLPRHM